MASDLQRTIVYLDNHETRIRRLETQEVGLGIFGGKFAWAFQFGEDGGGVVADLARIGPVRIPEGITSVTLDKISMMATLSGSIIFKVMSASFGTAIASFTEVSSASDRPSLSSARSGTKTSFTSWDLIWASGDELFVEVVGAATTIEQVVFQMEGNIQA